jgi:hypothetical protein
LRKLPTITATFNRFSMFPPTGLTSIAATIGQRRRRPSLEADEA